MDIPPIAQLVEQSALNRTVGGSNPSGRTRTDWIPMRMHWNLNSSSAQRDLNGGAVSPHGTLVERGGEPRPAFLRAKRVRKSGTNPYIQCTVSRGDKNTKLPGWQNCPETYRTRSAIMCFAILSICECIMKYGTGRWRNWYTR